MRILTFLTLTLAAFASALAQTNMNSQGGNFKGQVRYENNAPASYVKIEIWSDGGPFRTTVSTDDQGRFSVQAPFAVIQYRIEMPGYRVVQGREDISMSGRATEDLTLKAMPGTTPPTAAAGPIDARIAAIPPEAKKEFDVGQKAVTANDFAGAIPHLQKAIDLYPKYA